jgi:hypothetical protein
MCVSRLYGSTWLLLTCDQNLISILLSPFMSRNSGVTIYATPVGDEAIVTNFFHLAAIYVDYNKPHK